MGLSDPLLISDSVFIKQQSCLLCGRGEASAGCINDPRERDVMRFFGEY